MLVDRPPAHFTGETKMAKKTAASCDTKAPGKKGGAASGKMKGKMAAPFTKKKK